jgi:hypothetical protein
MTEAEWLSSDNPYLMLEFLRGRTSDRKLRLIAVASCYRAREFTEHWYHELADVAEAFADGRATAEEMAAVHSRHRPSNDYGDRNAFYNTAGPDLAETIPNLVEDLADWIAQCKVEDEGKSLGEWEQEQSEMRERELAITAQQVREIAGNPFWPAALEPHWRTRDLVAMAELIAEEQAFDRLPILADALEEAGCTNADLLDHLRSPVPHLRGCWALDLILGKG